MITQFRFPVPMLGHIAEILDRGRKAVLVHGNADPDAMGCAYAIAHAFDNVDIVVTNSMDRVSKSIYSHIEVELLNELEPDRYDTIIVVDTSSPDQINFEGDLPECVVIDHHARTDRWEGNLYYCDDSKRSCAEIVHRMIKDAGKPITREMGLALLTGMLTDSGHFTYSTPDLLKSFAEIQEETGVQIDEVLALTNTGPNMGERVSQLKGAQRLRFERIGGYIIAISIGSTYESSVCKSMLSIGADVAFVGSQRGNEFRLSSRANQGIVRRGLHLGRIMEKLSRETGNDGGGHPGAAGMTGIGDVEAILNICVSRTLDLFRQWKREDQTEEG